MAKTDDGNLEPPKGTLTIEQARLLPGLIGIGDMTVRRTLKSAELGKKWPQEGRARFTLWDAAKARELAARRLQPKGAPEPRRDREPEKRLSVSPDVPDGWSTTWELQETLDRWGGGDGEPTVRQVRRVLQQNVVGPPVPDAVDERICDAFDRLFDKAGLLRLARKIPSERRLVALKDKYGRRVPKIHRVYPYSEALEWFEEAQDNDVDETADRCANVISYATSVEKKGLVLNIARYIGRRNHWLPFIAALFGESTPSNAEGRGYAVGRFIAKRKPHWRGGRTDSRVIADELAIQLDRLRSL